MGVLGVGLFIFLILERLCAERSTQSGFFSVSILEWDNIVPLDFHNSRETILTVYASS